MVVHMKLLTVVYPDFVKQLICIVDKYIIIIIAI